MSKIKSSPGILKFAEATSESYDGSKVTSLMDDEDGVFPRTFWPAMTRCFYCGRFRKRGIKFVTKHILEDCPLNKSKT